MMSDPTTQNLNDLLTAALNDQNKKIADLGWVAQSMESSTRYSKGILLENRYVEIMVDLGKEHVNLFSICLDLETIHLLGGGNKYFAEVHEGTGPFECIERPMTEQELTTLYSTFKSELEGFEQVRRGCLFFGMNAFDTKRGQLKPVIIKDLEEFYSNAMEGLKG